MPSYLDKRVNVRDIHTAGLPADGDNAAAFELMGVAVMHSAETACIVVFDSYSKIVAEHLTAEADESGGAQEAMIDPQGRKWFMWSGEDEDGCPWRVDMCAEGALS